MVTRILMLFILTLLFGQFSFANNKQLTFPKKQTIVYYVDSKTPSVVQEAIQLFEQDLGYVLESSLKKGSKKDAKLVVHNLSMEEKDKMAGRHEAFRIEIKKGVLYVTGSDANGTAYGIMELSRLLGVSPWEWWADSYPEKLEQWTLPSNLYIEQSPIVAYRGIFLNDEDWGLNPWSWKNYEPSTEKGRMGPKTYERIFKLMLRLRANIIWPAMHDNCTIPFYLVEGNKEVAERFGITIGTSHHEPMNRNTNEWNSALNGGYNYVNNSEKVYKFWEERVKEVANYHNYFTVGMRGTGDGGMQGASSLDDQRKVLERVLKDQRELIAKYVNPDVTKVPQVFIPYKEVLDIYHSGLKVPEDITLMWCDDNYGFMSYLPNKQEQERKGGNGIYYHLSYWGRPHDYLWLASTSPALIQTELERAYNNNVRQLWIFNVGDIKPAEYLLEYCLDMAWDKNVLVNRNINDHLSKWLKREFGEKMADKLLPVWNEYYALNYRCRPEFLGNTRVEERDPVYEVVKDMPWTDSMIEDRLKDCHKMENEILSLSQQIDGSKRAQWYQLVEYPIRSCCAMNRKMLGAQLARHGKVPWKDAVKGYDDIVSMSEYYNSMLDGKWKYIMSFKPRNLPVFEQVDTTLRSTPVPEPKAMQWKLKPSEGHFTSSSYTVKELGYSREALVLKEGDIFSASLPVSTDSLMVTLAFVPAHGAGTDKLQIKVEIDGGAPRLINYETIGRSEEWKMNVLYNQALRTLRLPPSQMRREIRIQAMTPSVVLDEIIVKSVRNN